MLIFLSVGPFFEEGKGVKKIWPEAEIFGLFSIGLSTYMLQFIDVKKGIRVGKIRVFTEIQLHTQI